jgi:pimeloyl-ACP methyl ester carboxylesterase
MPIWRKVAADLGVKLISASMPGFGHSDSYPLGVERSLLDWPADIKAVLDQENISKIHLFGISAGGIHVAALAHGLPLEMVGNVCFICPTCPDDVPGSTDHMAFVPKMMRALMGKPYIGDFIAYLISRLISPRFFLSQLPDCKAALERADREMPELAQGFLEQFAHGLSFTHRGIVDNARTIGAPPPFDMGELQKLTNSGHAVSITTAGDDTTNPYMMQRWFHSQIPGSTMMRFADGWGHLHGIPPENFKRVLEFLMTGQDAYSALELPSLLSATGRQADKKGYDSEAEPFLGV